MKIVLNTGYAQAPQNDDCSNAIPIPIPANGFGLGNFTSVPTNLTNATVQVGETYAPAIFVAGLDKKSVWYKFSIPTIRAVRVTLTQPGVTITAGDAGFAVFQTNSCLPSNANISTKLTPIVTFGNTYHPCVPAGDYLIQVSSKLAANGPITIGLEITDQTGAAYDHPNQAYSFGVAANYARKIDFETECQSIEDSAEICSALFNYREYHKSAWFTFTTPAYLDYFAVTLSGIGTTQYFPSGGANILKKFGYTLYKGNVLTTPYNTLPVIDGCDSMLTNGYRAAVRRYTCDQLLPNTTYSIQLFFHKDFKDALRLGLMTGGVAPTAAPLPVTGMPATNALGILNASGNGTTNTMYDYFGCNSRLGVTACGSAIPATGINFGGVNYNLSSFATFTLSGAAAITFRPTMTVCGPRPIVRLFKQSVSANCADLDTTNLLGTVTYNNEIECLAPGNYVVQILGTDAPLALTSYYSSTPANNSDQCLFSNLGSRFRLDMIVFTRKASNKYSLNVTGAFDTINRVGSIQQPLVSGVAYKSSPDTIGCLPTLRPGDTTCSPLNDKVIYRQFIVADSGTVDFSELVYSNNPPFRYRLYSGDANALAAAQNIFNYPDRINGLVPKSLCLDGSTYCTNRTACVLPGTYTFTSFGSVGDVGRADRPTFTYVKTRTKHNSPFNAHNMGSIMDTLGPNGGTLRSYRDYWSCDDNAVPINGYIPCTIGGRPATKAIYRQFYLKEDAIVRFSNPGYGGWCVNNAYGTRTLFYGKATDGFTGLSPVGNQWNCFSTAQTTNSCTPLIAGWYTVVSYGTGPSYDSTMRLTNIGGRYNGYVSYQDEFDITITPACPGPKFNRPHKASVAAGNNPHLIQWGTRAISTPVYPRTDTSFILPTENFNCTLDTPFSNHPIKPCQVASNRVAYYVFSTTQVSFLQINTGGYYAAVFDRDVRTDSMLFATAVPIQQCNNSLGNIQFCHFQPGTYTLVIFAQDATGGCRSVTPRIFIDQVGYSRFDFAGNAYDFDVVPPNSVYQFGKVGDINPLHPTRPPSSDFIYCTTGAYNSDPTNTACDVNVNGNIYSTANNQPLYDSVFPPVSGNIARRNLWYTFVINHPGTVNIKVENKTLQRGLQPRFAVYSSDVDASLPFSSVKAGGLVDSTVAQGLKFITLNYITYYNCYNAPNNISFYRDPCTATPTRYYILVDNVNGIASEAGGQLPNTQIDVSIKLDSFNLVLPKYDHYSQAGNIGTIGAGTFAGPADNYSCATRDNTDPLGTGQNTCSKTLWYKFTSTITGNVRYRIRIGTNLYYNADDIQLFNQTIPGDSTSNGLKLQVPATVSSPSGSWSQSCVTMGTYYLLLPGCNRVNQYVIPEIELIEQEGDFCSRAVPALLPGAGTLTATVLVNCHTIGSDYGEFGPQLTCPPGAATNQYKSSWFRIDIGGNDTLDVTTYLVENTNASSSDIKYRLMTGDCGAMQEQSCVLDALTQNTYQCLVPGQSYFMQVFTPVLKGTIAVTGTIDLKLSAIAHADTCAPSTNCLVNANFDTAFNCSTADSVKFVNFSTYGSSISYQWSFGYNNQTSTAVSPSFFYPAMASDQAYTVKLIVSNDSCQLKDSVTRTITIPGRPYVNLGTDITQCNSTAPIILRATSHAGATYLWQNNSVADTFRVTATGNNTFWVRVNYNGCSRRDTIKVLISPISSRPLQQINLCTDSVLVDVRRGFGETYRWNTGATTRSIYMSTPGYYWVDITYFNCVYRDSFDVNNVNASRPFGNDTTVCLTNGGFILKANMPGAISYSWQNNSTADTFLVKVPGQYRVAINYGNCTIRDTVNILGYPAPVTVVSDTSICDGETFLMPWGTGVTAAGTYRDTLDYPGGCDSLIRQINLSVKAKPSIGSDTTICFSQGSYTINATTSGAVGYNWQDGNTGAQYVVTTPGLYSVQVNYGSCVVSDSININDFIAPLKVTVDTSICLGSSFTLPWGQVVQDPGTYSDTLASSGGGCDSLIRIYNLRINAQPVLGNDAAANICSGNSINLSTFFITTGLTTSWTINNNAVLFPDQVNVPGSYRLIAGNAGGCVDTAFVIVTLNSKPDLGNDTIINICNGASVNLNAVFNTSGLSSTWTINGNAVINPTNISIAGRYQLIATNGLSCADTAYLTLIESPKLIIGNDTTLNICSGRTVNLSGIYNTSGFNSSWTFNSLPVSNPIAIELPGIYQLIATITGGCSDTANVTIGFNPQLILGNDSTAYICEGSSYDLLKSYNTTGLIWQWSINGSPVDNPATVITAGKYDLIAANGFGCTDSASIYVNINPKPSVGNDTTISSCNGNSINLNNIFSTTGLVNNWTINGLDVVNPASVNVSGDYQLIAGTAFGCSDTSMITLTFNPKPIIGDDTTIRICNGNNINLAGLYNTTGLSTSWELSGNTVTNPAEIGSAGIYRLIGINSNGCTDTALATITLNTKPTLGNDTTINICQGNIQNLTTVYTTTGFSSSWTNNGNFVNNPAVVSAAGAYQLIVNSGFNCADTALLNLVITQVPNIGNDTVISICQGLVINLTSLYPAGSLTGTWTRDGIAITNPVAVGEPGLYRVIGSNGSGCKDTALITLTIIPKTNLGADTIINRCIGNTLNLSAIYNTGSNSDTWSLNGVKVNNTSSISTAGLYQLVSSNASGCADTVDVLVNFVAKPIVIINDPLPVCAPQTVNLTTTATTTGSSPGLIFSYWQDSAAAIPYNNPGNAASGIYYIKGTNNFGCYDVKRINVTNYTLPIVNAGNDQVICDQDITTLTATVSNITAPVTYQWEPVIGGGIVSPASSITNVKPAKTSQFIVTVKDTYGCGFKISDTVTVTVRPPVPAFAGNDTTSVTGQPHQLRATGGTSYTWLPRNVLNNPGIANPLATLYSDSTLFSVIVMDNAGCKGYDSVWVRTFNDIKYYVPNAFSPNGDSKNDVFRPIPVGIASTEVFRIFNRYGDMVFETSQLQRGWDGMFRGRQQPIGNYIWILKGRDRNGKVIEMRGNVVLVR